MSVKKQILDIVAAMETQIGIEKLSGLLSGESKGEGDQIGCNQFREIAALCRQAESCEEIKLMIQYNIAKAKNNVSWKYRCSNGKRFGDIVLSSMDKVIAIKEGEVLENLELYFGYLYWQARVWADQYRTEKKKDDRSSSGNYNKPSNNRKPQGKKYK